MLNNYLCFYLKARSVSTLTLFTERNTSWLDTYDGIHTFSNGDTVFGLPVSVCCKNKKSGLSTLPRQHQSIERTLIRRCAEMDHNSTLKLCLSPVIRREGIVFLNMFLC